MTKVLKSGSTLPSSFKRIIRNQKASLKWKYHNHHTLQIFFLPRSHLWPIKSEFLGVRAKHLSFKKFPTWGSPGGSVVKNFPPMQETRVQSLVQEDPTCCGATKPGGHNYWVCALEPRSCNYRSPRCPRACAPQREKPLHWEARAPQLKSSPCSLQLQKNPCSIKNPAQPKINKIFPS